MRHKPGRLLGALACLTTSLLCQTPDAKRSAIDSLAATYVKSGKVPGLAIGIMHDGEIVLSKGYGLANLEQETQVTPATVFRINSMTKQFTAAGIMLLAERGLLRSDSALAEFLPDFPRAREITIRQLLSHTAGLSSYDNKPDFRSFSLQRHTIGEVIQWMRSDPFASTPGTAWEYSHSGFLLLAGVIEKVSGQPYADFLQKNIFDRLKLSHTSVDDEQAIVAHRAGAYSPVAEKPGEFRNTPFPAAINGGGGASIHSTVGDLLRWHEALFHGQAVKPSSFAEMVTPARLNNGDVVAATRIIPGAHYGYGLFLSDLRGHPKIGHTGTGPGSHSVIMTYPADRYTIVVLCNVTGRPPYALEIEKAIAELVIAP